MLRSDDGEEGEEEEAVLSSVSPDCGRMKVVQTKEGWVIGEGDRRMRGGIGRVRRGGGRN